jgi:DNA-binding transcriptional LysR family regulator
MHRNLDVSLLRALAAVADHGSITAASNTLHLTQGAVSQQIARLEELFGRALLIRGRRGVRLTQAGERLLGKGRRLLSLNDDIWSDMTGRTVDGTVRLGVPYDLAGAYLSPVLKTYAQAFPQVDIALVCASSPELIDGLANGETDLAVVEQTAGSSTGECLAIERLVWVGAKAGSSHLKRPLPVSMVTDTCAFRPAVLAALGEQGREWKTVFENGSIDATTATVRADLAVTTWLERTVPLDLDILPPGSGLPELPSFSINLHLPQRQATRATMEMARHIRAGLAVNNLSQ